MIRAKEILELIQEQQYRCTLSGLKLTPETAALDHKVARSNGGTDEKENLQVIHVTINRMKHTLSNEEFVEWCRMVVENCTATVG